MGCPELVFIGDNLLFSICTHDPGTGELTDADDAPTYRIYEDETGTAILTGTMAKLDDANTTGFYVETITCSNANGFENRKTYTIYIEATVSLNTGGSKFHFKVLYALPWQSTPSAVIIGDDHVFSIVTHDPDTGVLTDADAAPTYRIYEGENGTAIANGNMAKLDDAGTTGFYSEKITCSAANGYEDRKNYTIYIEATVDGDTGGIAYNFIAYTGPTVSAGLDQIKRLSEAIYSRFINVGTDLQALIGMRFYKMEAPEATDFPYIVYDIITDVPEYPSQKLVEYIDLQFSIFSTTQASTEVEEILTELKNLYDDCELTITNNTIVYFIRGNLTTMRDEVTVPQGSGTSTSQIWHYAQEYSISIVNV